MDPIPASLRREPRCHEGVRSESDFIGREQELQGELRGGHLEWGVEAGEHPEERELAAAG